MQQGFDPQQRGGVERGVDPASGVAGVGFASRPKSALMRWLPYAVPTVKLLSFQELSPA